MEQQNKITAFLSLLPRAFWYIAGGILLSVPLHGINILTLILVPIVLGLVFLINWLIKLLRLPFFWSWYVMCGLTAAYALAYPYMIPILSFLGFYPALALLLAPNIFLYVTAYLVFYLPLR